ncbi:MAG: transcriptional regulator [Bacteroidia bacterium]|nr:transcriptional regulator [Bacteroidia bacterium]
MTNPISNISKVFESRVRLGIMSILMVNDWVEFNLLKELLDVTDGNLASHLKSLEENTMIEVKKQFVGRKPKTTYRVTESGKIFFKNHLKALEELINRS